MKNSAARRRFNVFVAVLLTVVTLAVFGCALWYGMRQKPKRGIVIVTALLSGGLVEVKDDGTETVVWDPVPMEEFPIQEVLLPDGSLNMSTELITEILNSFENGILDVLDLVTGDDGFINALKVDKNTGKSVRNIKPATSETDSHVKYGVLNVYKQTYDSMMAEYGDEAEISVFNYDWRLDNVENGRLLEEYINSKLRLRPLFIRFDRRARLYRRSDAARRYARYRRHQKHASGRSRGHGRQHSRNGPERRYGGIHTRLHIDVSAFPEPLSYGVRAVFAYG